MPRTHLCFLTLIAVLISPCHARPQTDNAQPAKEASLSDQEDFALANAHAHARSSLFGADGKPMHIHATIQSRLALHAIGSGTYDNRWIDTKHWHRTIRFDDYQSDELRNDDGRNWFKRTNVQVPIRVNNLLDFVILHVPGSTGAAKYVVEKSLTIADDGRPTTCYTAVSEQGLKSKPVNRRWCFDVETGLLISEDRAPSTHVIYSGYQDFLGKQYFTHVRVLMGGLPVMEINVTVDPLDPHALDGEKPDAEMRRYEKNTPSLNPEEVKCGMAEFRPVAKLPAGTPDSIKSKPARVIFYIGEDSSILDAAIEDAPSEPMAESAIETAKSYHFSAPTSDGKPFISTFHQAVWFEDGTTPTNGVYHNDELGLTFGYPKDFTPIPKGELTALLEKKNRETTLENGKLCFTIPFIVQQLKPGQTTPEIIKIEIMDKSCIMGVLDRNTLINTVERTVNNIGALWDHPHSTGTEVFSASGRLIIGTSIQGNLRIASQAEHNVMVLMTSAHGNLISIYYDGPEDDLLDLAQRCSLSFSDK